MASLRTNALKSMAPVMIEDGRDIRMYEKTGRQYICQKNEDPWENSAIGNQDVFEVVWGLHEVLLCENFSRINCLKKKKSLRHAATMSKQYLTAHTVDDAHITDIFALATTPTALISGSGSSALHVRSTTDSGFPKVQTIEAAHKLGVHHVCTARHGVGNVAASAGFGGEIKLWKRTEGDSEGSWELWWEIEPARSGSGGDIWAIALSADESYLACTTHDGRIQVWDLERREIIQTYATGGGGSSGSFGIAVDLSRDGRLTASGHQSGSVYVFNNDAGRLVFSLPGLVKPVRAVAFSPGCKRLAAAGNAGIIALYDMAQGEHVGNLLPTSNNNAWITSLDWNDTGDYLLSGSLDGKVRVWDINSGTCVATHSETDKALWSVRWLPKANKLTPAGIERAEMFCSAGANRSISFYREATGV